jgi:hypothetical protein
MKPDPCIDAYIAKAAPFAQWLAEGKKRNWQYQNC